MKIQKIIEIDIPNLGEQIKKARKADGRSLTQLCAIAGMTPANWHKIEAEEKKALPIDTLCNIEKALGVKFLEPELKH